MAIYAGMWESQDRQCFGEVVLPFWRLHDALYQRRCDVKKEFRTGGQQEVLARVFKLDIVFSACRALNTDNTSIPATAL